MTMTPFPPLDRTSSTFKGDLDALFGTRVPNFVNEANLLAANFNSIAAGGAYAIPFVNRSSASDVGGNGGIMVIDGVSQAAATRLVFDQVGSNNMLVQAPLDSLFSSTSTIKGYVRLVKQGDPSKWVLFRVDSWVPHTGATPYGELFGATISASSTNPFTYNDSIMLQAQGNGNKGDKGDNGTSVVPTLYVRDEKSQGTNGGAITSGAARTLNTVKVNGISGATVSSNRVTLPAGVYNMLARAPANTVGAHRVVLWDVTTNTPYEVGTSEYCLISNDGIGYSTSRSIVEARNAYLGSSRTFELRHYFAGSGGSDISGGRASNAVYSEVYAELIFEKVG